MANGQTEYKALADAMIKRGETLLDKTQSEIENSKTPCPVSASLPSLVHWQAEVKLAELKSPKLNGQQPAHDILIPIYKAPSGAVIQLPGKWLAIIVAAVLGVFAWLAVHGKLNEVTELVQQVKELTAQQTETNPVVVNR